ncbi:MAG: phospholipase D-like domain-containing protein [Rickettsiales bacterium]|jgi:phosphatidylserine/phosphatidylglycerophosphate/cardiolipin synthase-like enzyme|nr:phospholipase D-like domain-containing protein [Rickettsiales bacterium]
MYLIIATLLIILVAVSAIPTSFNDKKTQKIYKVKIRDKDLLFNPLLSPLAKIYKKELGGKNATGATILEDGISAFIARAAFSRLATKTIEVQTYIYKNDKTSKILIHELKAAADRGVKVRILVDDHGMDSDISDMMMLDFHPNIEVKVFNTFKYRRKLTRFFQLLFDFKRLNSRMHNKLFIVDGIAVIIGGRNIADSYFYPQKAVNFSDTDVLFLGNIAKEALQSFNKYWKYHLSVPACVFPRRKILFRKSKIQQNTE